MNPLEQLSQSGQSIWLDFISRELVTTDQLHVLITDSCVTGLTSNPTIFQKALAEGQDYDQQIHELIDAGESDPEAIFWHLAVSDIQRAADEMREIHQRTEGADGFVSLEVAPATAHDTERTWSMVAELWRRVDRPNLMIKIPATPEGIPAIRRAIAAGYNVNVTLIFALSAYQQVVDAYIGGLEDRHGRGESLDVHSVASFFVSRVDTEADKRLEAASARDGVEPASLLGKAAIANAVCAYELFEKEFRHSERFSVLAAAGAHVQRPLWASTSAKNPHYRDVLYAEALVGTDTVDTMPPKTIEAFHDHGEVRPGSVSQDYPGAHRVLEQMRQVGVDIDDVTTTLLAAGVTSFADSFDELIGELAAKIGRLRGGHAQRQSFSWTREPELLETALKEPAAAASVGRVWSGDPSLWKPGDDAAAAVIKNRLGWLNVVESMRRELPRLTELGRSLVKDGIRDVVLLGMGGSSLCPEVLRTAFGPQPGKPVLHVLDTTDPAAIETLTAGITPQATLFIVASKSGKTLETLSHYAHFWDVCQRAGVSNIGSHFVAVTDPGSHLATEAERNSFRSLFLNPQDIGGRYSALSFFGLVPAACAGMDVEALLSAAAEMRLHCAQAVPAKDNCGLYLGTAMAQLAARGHDKVTIAAPPQISAFSLWAEQLIAESTGKEGKGLIPIGDEPLGDPSVYGDDRLFVALTLPDQPADFTASVEKLKAAGQPVVELQLSAVSDLGAEFFRWEFATALAGAALGIDPFDEPNVQESKDNTNAVLAGYEKSGSLPEEKASVSEGDIAVYGETGATPAAALRSFIDASHPGDYVALMAYVTPDEAYDRALQALRSIIRDERHVATTLGFGPRFLHSTGQLHKGGPNTGIYIQLVGDDPSDVSIPNQKFSFHILKQAQADGDLASLRSHGRRVIRIHIAGDFVAGVQALASALSTTAGATA